MLKFLKENSIFITNSILLIGLAVGVSALKQMPTSGEININQVPVPNTVSISVDNKNTGEQISNPSTLPDVNIQRQPRENEDNDSEEYDD